MLGAIGSSSGYVEQTAPSTAGLEAQLSRCRQQLSETVNCASYSTMEGKRKAQDITSRIGELEGRIEQIRNNHAQIQGVKASEKTAVSGKVLASTAQDAVTKTYASGSLGTRLDVFA